VNNAYKLGQWDGMFFGDCRWFKFHVEGLANFAGLKITTCPQHENKPGIKVIQRKGGSSTGLSNDPRFVAWGLSSGYAAINIATLLGSRRVVLLGFDMRKRMVCHECDLPFDDEPKCPHCNITTLPVNDNNLRANWHTDHKTGARPNHNPYRRFLAPFKAMVKVSDKLGIEIINATPGSKLTTFPIVDPEEVLPPKVGVPCLR
jgi:hypothetical protein